jgi:hypothetical protein
VFPKNWRNGIPYGENITEDVQLQNHFTSVKRDSTEVLESGP